MGNGSKQNGGLPQTPAPILKPPVPSTPVNHSLNALHAWDRWTHAHIDLKRLDEITKAAFVIMGNMQKYRDVGDQFGIPFWVIGVIHYRESSFDFNTWLANGDSLKDVTHHVPKGLGPVGSWQEGAVLSLRYEGWRSGMSWDLANALLHLEAYNGMGYANRGVPSPYIWAGTDQYVSGKYVGDDHYDPTHVDQQLGCAAIALVLKSKGVDLSEVPVV